MKQFTQIITGMLLAFLLLPMASPVAAGAPMVVQGTNTAPDDLIAVQAAVDNPDADQVILEGIFDFDDGTLVITRNVTLRGRHGALIRNGGVGEPQFFPTIAAIPPATQVEIRDLNMVGAADAALLAHGFDDGIIVDFHHNNITSALSAGIAIYQSPGSRIRNNTVSDSTEGILVETSDAVDVRNNTVEAHDVGFALVDVSQSTFTNNAVTIIGDSAGPFDVGRTGVFLAPLVQFDDAGSPTFLAGNTNNHFRNTRFEGEMTYGFLLGEGSDDNAIDIAPRNLDRATFVPPPLFGLCDNNQSGATVLFMGATDFGPASAGNSVKNRSQAATFLHCGVDNVVD